MSNLQRSPEGWVSNTTSNQSVRKSIVGHWVAANGWNSAAERIEQIRSGTADLYITADNLVKHLLKKGLARSTVFYYRSYLPEMFTFCKLSVDETSPIPKRISDYAQNVQVTE